MTKRKLASNLCKREGKKSQVAMGDMMEALTVLQTAIAEEWIESRDQESVSYDCLMEGAVAIFEKLLKKELKKINLSNPARSSKEEQ
jgi:hypothetical protein